MKQKISITIDEEALKTIERVLKKQEKERFRNRSHVIEYSLNKFLEKEINNQVGGK